MSRFPVVIPYSFGWDGPNALPLTFPFTFGIQFGDAALQVSVTAPADIKFASANGIAALPITPASTASAHRTAWGNADVPVLAGATATLYWTMNVQTAKSVTAALPAAAAIDAVSGTDVEVTVGIPIGMELTATADGSVAVEVGITPPSAALSGLLDNGVTATAGFTADLTLDATGDASLSTEAMFLANEQELGLLDTTAMWVAVIGADMTLAAQANTDTVQVTVAFTADAPLSGVMDADTAVDVAVSAAVAAAFSGHAELAVTDAPSLSMRRTQYAHSETSVIAGTGAGLQAEWSANAPRLITVSPESDFSARFYSWAECHGTATSSAAGLRTQYANLNEPVPIALPLTLPYVFGGMLMPGEITANITAEIVLSRSLDADLSAEAILSAGQKLDGVAHASTEALVHVDKHLTLDGYGYADLAVSGGISSHINAALYGYAPLRGVVFIEGAEDELALGNASVRVTVALPAAANLDGVMIPVEQPIGVTFGDPVLSYPISAELITVTAANPAIGSIDHPAEAGLVIVPVVAPGEMSANFAANAKTAVAISTGEAFRVGYLIAAQLGITSQRSVDAIVGLIKAGLVVTANATVDATLQPLVNSQVTGWWHFPE